MVLKGSSKTGYYLHEVQVKEKLLDVFKTGLYTGTQGALRSILVDVYSRVKEIEEKCSKIVDENREPLVVYHGTTEYEIRKFRRGKKKQMGPGMYFAVKRSKAEDYVNGADDKIYEVFLNVLKPLMMEKGNGSLRSERRECG